jgi:hypothetical protein
MSSLTWKFWNAETNVLVVLTDQQALQGQLPQQRTAMREIDNEALYQTGYDLEGMKNKGTLVTSTNGTKMWDVALKFGY